MCLEKKKFSSDLHEILYRRRPQNLVRWLWVLRKSALWKVIVFLRVYMIFYLYIVHLLSISLLLIGNLSLSVWNLFILLKYSNYTLYQDCVYKMNMATYFNSLLLKCGHPRTVTYWISALISFQFLEYLSLFLSRSHQQECYTDWLRGCSLV